ncbi:MAG: hypothetical protein A2V93_10775 [Ignavibacteria bacterium RBG_16_34_14]|nr:MAG: hypothetical protein A2V93_10775 [Ignavibacteria bacterium RBG_16_34_14]
MAVIHYPVNAAYIGKFKLLIEFENGELRIADFSSYKKRSLGDFSDLKDEKYFKTFFIKDGDLQWPNGWDVAPDYLYDISTPAIVLPVKRRTRLTKVK